MLLYSILAGILIFLLLLMFVPTLVGVDYMWKQKTQNLRIRFRVLGIRFSVKVPLNKKKEQKGEKKDKKLTPQKFIAFSKELYRAYRAVEDDCKELLHELKTQFTCREIYFTIRYGTANPAKTGILNGAVWTAGTLLLKVLDTALNVSEKTLNVYPEFNRSCMCIHIKGTFRFTLFNAIRFVLKVIRLVKLIKSKITIEF
ncbi:MAG: DUF2953 domain-containing protein [Clostridia bacterium]|nr:DUF2953 domain-containing protein [Clostridia bacterium]